MLLVGFAAKGIVDADLIESADQILPFLITTVMNLPGWVYGLVGAGALAAAMSSADAITHNATLETTDGVIRTEFQRSIRQDRFKDYAYRCIRHRRIGLYYYHFRRSRINCLTLRSLWSDCTICSGSLQCLVLAGSNGKRSNQVDLVVGAILNFYFQLVADSTPFGIHAGIIGLIVNVIIMIVVSLLTKSERSEEEDIYIRS